MAEGGELLLLILSNGMPFSDMAAVIEKLKNSSKSIGTHKRRELYWNAYGAMSSKVSSMEGGAHCFLLYKMNAEGEGAVEVVDLTKRQRGLVGGGIDMMGQKLKPPEDPTSKHWCMAFSEDDAQKAWDDFMSADPCIYLTVDGVYAATRYKRVLCKGLSGPLKTIKEVEALISELKPDKPLRSVSFVGNDPPAISGYNTFIAGPCSFADSLPATIGHVATTSTGEIYDYFLQRRNSYLVDEAGKLIAQMLTDVNKSQMPIVSASSTKEAAIAYKNALMKRVFVHESYKKFVDRVRADGQVEMYVILGDVEGTDFGKYGKIVFEMFYRADLSNFGA